MMVSRRMTLVGALGSLLGGLGSRNAHAADVGPGRVSTEEGFVDIDLPIADVRREADGAVAITARALIDNVIVGFAIDIRRDWKATPLSGSDFLYFGKVSLRSLGEDSNRFVALLARLYKVSQPSRPMLVKLELVAVGLADDPSKVMTTPVRMKLFFDPDDEGSGEAEVYVNVDVAARKLQFNEKDPEYREPLVRALTEERS